jgi:hypothetical protein
VWKPIGRSDPPTLPARPQSTNRQADHAASFFSVFLVTSKYENEPLRPAGIVSSYVHGGTILFVFIFPDFLLAMGKKHTINCSCIYNAHYAHYKQQLSLPYYTSYLIIRIMRTINDSRQSFENFAEALRLLNGRLAFAGAPRFNLVVCGGTALIATNLLFRATTDVDIVALMDDGGALLDPEPLPQSLVNAAGIVAVDLGLPENWLNNGPSSGDGGLFRLGLPEGFVKRLAWKTFGENLSVGFIGRIDRIHFKLYAAVDQRGGYHADDLQLLTPTDEELLQAARWARTHDPSEGYLQSLEWFLREFGYEHLVGRI